MKYASQLIKKRRNAPVSRLALRHGASAINRDAARNLSNGPTITAASEITQLTSAYDRYRTVNLTYKIAALQLQASALCVSLLIPPINSSRG